MTLGIICTIVLGLIALWQHLNARAYRATVILYQQAFAKHTETLEIEQRYNRAMSARLTELTKALTRLQQPDVRYDPRAMQRVVYDACVAANAAAAAIIDDAPKDIRITKPPT